MIVVNEIVLITRNARDKIQTARYVLQQTGEIFIIKRFTGQFGGKITQQPDKIIDKGKAKRSVLQQAEQEYNSLIKKAVDKGYKKLSGLTKTKFDVITEQELMGLVSSVKTDANGNIKPQLAKPYGSCPTKTFDRLLYASRKLDGVRCLMRYDVEEDMVKTTSRGGGDYDASTVHIRTNDELVMFLRANPEIVLDGELYVHGVPLQDISGVARTKTWDDKCNMLEYHVYDIADVNTHFTGRHDQLVDLDLLFEDSEVIKICDHVQVEGWSSIKKLHDKWVSEGYEGLVLRASNKCYKPSSKSSDWIKVKMYQDAEFLITGVSEGLRLEDMCFELQTESGDTFKAKPVGDRKRREEYLENADEYIGKMGTVKFFELSKEGIPIGNTVFKAVRGDGE